VLIVAVSIINYTSRQLGAIALLLAKLTVHSCRQPLQLGSFLEDLLETSEDKGDDHNDGQQCAG